MGGEELTDSDRARLMEALTSDMRARSAIGPHASWLRTWTRFHHRWWGEISSPWPLTPQYIYAVAALMKDLGYRSFPNYVSASKDVHIQLGYPWSEQLKQAATRATASTQRGIGAAHQCEELRLHDALSVIHDELPLVHHGPAQCGHLFTLGHHHVVRGIELSSALAAHISVDTLNLTETWHLPVSKTDPQAIGCSRTWGCICGQAAACPYHAALSQLEWLSSRFGRDDGSLPPNLPLFPTIEGAFVSAERLTATVNAVASRLDLQLTDDLGRTAFSEHVFRVSGSRMLARAGVPIETIKLLARWSTSIVDRYVGDTPLERLTSQFRQVPSGINFADLPLPLAAAVPTGTDEGITSVPLPLEDSQLAGVQSQLDQLSTHLDLLSDEVDPSYVRNHRSRVVHRRGAYGSRTSPRLWRTPCGWYFGAPTAEATWLAAVTETSPDLICSTCLPELLISLCEI